AAPNRLPASIFRAYTKSWSASPPNHTFRCLNSMLRIWRRMPLPRGALQIMNDEELEGVIAHELSHVRNYDILTSSIAATIAGAVTYMAQMGRWAMIFGGYGGNRDDDRGGGGLSALLMIFLAPFAALLLQLFLSRTREYAADETGARMVGQPYGLISALEKLGAYNRRIP